MQKTPIQYFFEEHHIQEAMDEFLRIEDTLKKAKDVKLYQRKHCKSCKIFNRGCYNDVCDKHTKPWDKACENYVK